MEVDVWLARLGGAPADVLDAGERDRARRFLREEDRRRFIAAHSMLRCVLSRYLGEPPASIRFERAAEGKPYVPWSRIRFNLSHSGDLAVCAVAEDREVGVDVERIRPVLYMDRILERFFPSEQAHDAEAFFRLWTRREAWVKATGRGLAGFEDAPGPRWSIESLKIADGYAGAVAAEGAPLNVRIFTFPGDSRTTW
jgi:4'-phosphopantetheinyl transferase